MLDNAYGNNPFAFERAVVVDDDVIIDWFCDERDLSSLLLSPRNAFIIGNRGSGKTMMLRYRDIKSLRDLNDIFANDPIINNNSSTPKYYFGVYVPCREGALFKKEEQLCETEPERLAISRHMLSLYFLYKLLYSLSRIPSAILSVIVDIEDEKLIRGGLCELIGKDIETCRNIFFDSSLAVNRISLETQKRLNNPSLKEQFPVYYSAESLFFPVFDLFKHTKYLSKFHFMLLVDDADSLDNYQMPMLNTWIGYRGHAAYSFKVAITRRVDYNFITSTKGDIIDGHDYSTISLEYPLHHQKADFGKLATNIIIKRLRNIGISKNPKEYFTMDPGMEQGLKESNEELKLEAKKIHPEYDKKQCEGYAYKRYRARYFQKRYAGQKNPGRANRPPYSGFDTLTFLSTGIIRNLLEPCHLMYDIAIQETKPIDGIRKVDHIPVAIQHRVIDAISSDKWKLIEEGLSKHLKGLTIEDDEAIRNLLKQLAKYFLKRFMSNISEPNANSFSVNWVNTKKEDKQKLLRLFDIMEKAQILYVRMGISKEGGLLEEYFVPNRALWPAVGLDPYGQHARVQLPAMQLLSASEGRKIPFGTEPDEQEVLL